MDEFEFIDSVRGAFEDIGDDTIKGIGDDCAVIPVGGGASMVVTTDMLVEGVHFLLHATSARELGVKSLAVNLSDVAAMGARPVASFLSIALPAEFRGEWVMEFMEGYREMSERYAVRLAGGDTTSSASGMSVNVTAIGTASNDRLKYRSGARPGDIVAVGGILGESAAGLQDILAGRFDTASAHAHRNPEPQVEQGEWLGGRTEVHSMIDLSDGLASDLVHILKASGVGAEVELTAVPIPPPMRASGEDAVELAVTGGEDYKLLFTVAPGDWEGLCRDYRDRFGAEPYAVGRIVPPARSAHDLDDPETVANRIVWLENGTPVTKNWRGFIHF